MHGVNSARYFAAPQEGEVFMRRTTQRKMMRIAMMAIIACAFLFGCGSASDTTPVDEITPAQDVGELSSLEKLIYSESYAGYLVVHLSEVDVPVEKLSISAYPPVIKAVDQIRPVIDAHPAVELKRSLELPEEEVDARRVYLEGVSGKKLTDFNLIYHVEISDPDEAVRVMRELAATSGVEKVYPKRKSYVAGLATVPDLTGKQGYLYSNETTGGLNAQAAWTAGAKGSGVMAVDAEFEWNYAHLDLPLTWGEDNWSAVSCYPTPSASCLGDLAHGTAVAGIIASLENAHGTTGFAPQLDIKTTMPVASALFEFTNGITNPPFDQEMPPGSIFIIESQVPGRLSGGNCSGMTEADQYGCTPEETDPEFYAAIEQATAAGVLVVEAVGNGSLNLEDPAVYWPQEVHLYEHDSGSVLVGASQGPNHQKISFSNCGSPVDAYAWGQGVVTTAYPYGGSTGPYTWETIPGGPNPPNDDNNAYFTNKFGGTSSATAMVAGAAALMQSYTKNLMGQKRYLTPAKLRQILSSTSVAQSGTDCNIGKQPRIDQAMTTINTFWNSIKTTYPKLVSGGRLTVTEMINLRTMWYAK